MNEFHFELVYCSTYEYIQTHSIVSVPGAKRSTPRTIGIINIHKADAHHNTDKRCSLCGSACAITDVTSGV